VWRLVSVLAALGLAAGAARVRAETITLTFEESEALTCFVSYVSTGAGPTGGAVEFDVDNGTSWDLRGIAAAASTSIDSARATSATVTPMRRRSSPSQRQRRYWPLA
jgi:hypothetical protein